MQGSLILYKELYIILNFNKLILENSIYLYDILNFMKKLYIYPTSRALRKISDENRNKEGFLPTLMRIDEFEARLILLDKIIIDNLQRTLFLQESADFEEFKVLHFELDFIRFFTKSNAIFKFFEELTQEEVSFNELKEADAYAQYDRDISILEKLFDNYKKLLYSKGLTDKAFIPNSYKLNRDFLENYNEIEIFLEGYLSKFELNLFNQVAQIKPLTIHYSTSSFNFKMQERFNDLGIFLPNNSNTSFSLTTKKIIKSTKVEQKLNGEVYFVEQRVQQVSVIFNEIERMVENNINPEDIVVVLPNEQFKEHLKLFDKAKNLNFAMGDSFSDKPLYKKLYAIYRYWSDFSDENLATIKGYKIETKELENINLIDKVTIKSFFNMLERFSFFSYEPVIEESYFEFSKLFSEQNFTKKEWLFLWLKQLMKIRIDDTNGGKITVLGVLETRGIVFDGVIIVDFNEGVVPTILKKDQFLSSTVRDFAKLPSKEDREALQKEYYKQLISKSKDAVIVYSTSEHSLPSKFLYELKLKEAKPAPISLSLFYDQESKLVEEKTPIVENFDASKEEWSPSKFKIFLECKRKFYYKYIENIPDRKDKDFNDGSVLHKLLEELFKSSFSNINELEIAFAKVLELNEELINDEPQMEYKKLLWKEKLKGFFNSQINHFNLGWRILDLEKKVSGTIDGIRFKGKIDRIDVKKDETLILDYKSGKLEKEKKEFKPEKERDFQMPIYYELLEKEHSNISLFFIKILEEGEMQKVEFLDERLELLKELIKELKETKSFSAFKCEDLKYCRYCEFTLLCQRGAYL